MKYLFYIFASILAAAAVFFFRQIRFPTFNSGFDIFEIIMIIKQPKLWIGLLLYGAAFLVFLYIVSRFEVSSSMPSLLGTYILVLAMMGHIILKEELLMQKVFAYILIISGIVLL